MPKISKYKALESDDLEVRASYTEFGGEAAERPDGERKASVTWRIVWFWHAPNSTRMDGVQRPQKRARNASQGLFNQFRDERRDTMIVNRRTFIIKPPHMEEAAALVRAEMDRVGSLPGFRIYLSNIGPFHVLAFEAEFDNLVEYERLVGEFFERVSPEFWEEWHSITEAAGGANEIWTLVE